MASPPNPQGLHAVKLELRHTPYAGRLPQECGCLQLSMAAASDGNCAYADAAR